MDCKSRLLIFPAVIVVLEGDAECQDADSGSPAKQEVANIREHTVARHNVRQQGVHVNPFQEEKGEHHGKEKVKAHADVSTRSLKNMSLIIMHIFVT